MFGLIPKEESFFELFEHAANNAHAAASAFDDMLEHYDEIDERIRKIKDLEHVGDQVTHETIERLNRTFITPMDREDIHELICRVDDIVDLVDTAAHRIVDHAFGQRVCQRRQLFPFDRIAAGKEALGRDELLQ